MYQPPVSLMRSYVVHQLIAEVGRYVLENKRDAKEANVKRLRNEMTRNAVTVTVILIRIDNSFNRLDKIVAVNSKVFDNIFRNFTLRSYGAMGNYDCKNYAIQ